jgi:hypothetical protein
MTPTPTWHGNAIHKRRLKPKTKRGLAFLIFAEPRSYFSSSRVIVCDVIRIDCDHVRDFDGVRPTIADSRGPVTC